MDFQGPLPVDYDNVRSLNTAFLELLQHKDSRRYLRGLLQHYARRLQRLSQTDIRRLAATPFLLFSFRERDDGYWRELLRDDRGPDLFTVPLQAADDSGRLISAGLGFVWQLANRNQFAARLLCGASTHWCEQIAERTFFNLVAVAAYRSDLLVLRAEHDNELWEKLLDAGLSEQTDARNAAHISAMQYLLTQQADSSRWQAAACASNNPTLRVAEDPESH